jgi:peptidoglycan/LPS O-acetylase OafA/YrhL
MNDLFAERIAGIPWLVLAGIAAALAVVYAILPAGEGTDGATWIILRWGHTVAWLFLAGAALARARVAGLPLEWAAPLGATGGLVYVILMVTVTNTS